MRIYQVTTMDPSSISEYDSMDSSLTFYKCECSYPWLNCLHYWTNISKILVPSTIKWYIRMHGMMDDQVYSMIQSLLPSSQLCTEGTVTLVMEVTWLAGKVGTMGGASIWGLAGGSFNIHKSLLTFPPFSLL